VLCTVRLSRALFPEQRHHNLDALIERFGLSCETRHRALPDARALVELARALSAALPAATLIATCESLTLTPHLPAGLDAALLEDLPDAPGVYLLYDPQGAALFAGRAGLRTQVLAHWGEKGPRARELRVALQSGALEWFTSAGPLGAALRQLRLIESLAPRHNRPPRTRNEAWALNWDPAGDASHWLICRTIAPRRPGPFRSQRDALAALRAEPEHGLCPQAPGWSRAAAPVRRTLNQCQGVRGQGDRRLILGGASPGAARLRWPHGPSRPIAMSRKTAGLAGSCIRRRLAPPECR
jgi:DNA polymerase-3 subunit epsilon